MIIYIFKSTKNFSGNEFQTINNIANLLQNNYQGLVINIQFSQQTTIYYHGGIALESINGIYYIQIVFFDTENSTITTNYNGTTYTLIQTKYSSIPSQQEIETLLQNGGYL
jgi:hypothetical protein